MPALWQWWVMDKQGEVRGWTGVTQAVPTAGMLCPVGAAGMGLLGQYWTGPREACFQQGLSLTWPLQEQSDLQKFIVPLYCFEVVRFQSLHY